MTVPRNFTKPYFVTENQRSRFENDAEEVDGKKIVKRHNLATLDKMNRRKKTKREKI